MSKILKTIKIIIASAIVLLLITFITFACYYAWNNRPPISNVEWLQALGGVCVLIGLWKLVTWAIAYLLDLKK